MEYNYYFFEKNFSVERMRKYNSLYPTNQKLALEHYMCNIMLSESLYPCLSIFEVALRNALVKELIKNCGHEQWYDIFNNNIALQSLKKRIYDAMNAITTRKEIITPSKITAELTFGFWVSLLNSEYETFLWHDLRRAFPNMPKSLRQRKNISSPLNRFRRLRNRIYHNEPICWNLSRVEDLHTELLKVAGWIDKQLPSWIQAQERVNIVCDNIRQRMSWG